MNEHDSERIAGVLELHGYLRADSAADADLVVFNTCAVRENADNRLYGALGQVKALKDRRPDVRVAVGGCQAQKDKTLLLEKAPWVDVAFGTFALADLPRLLAEREGSGVSAFEFREQTETYASALPARRAQPFHAWVSVSVGCDNSCSFCIVPSVRGRQVSRPMEEVLEELHRLADAGVAEVTLLGQNVNTYGRDIAGRTLFADLLRATGSVAGLRRVRFASPHPNDFTDDVVDAMASSPVVCEHIHFPLQSGSNAVLRAMRRSYRAEIFLRWLERIRVAIPGIAVSTDVIVGFPGESDEDFEQTMRVVEAARFDSAYTFQYSPRPGTMAAAMEPAVAAEVVAERFARLVRTQERISFERNQEAVGREVEVLVEGLSRKDAERLTARSRTNKIVHIAADGPVAGEFVTTRIVGAHPHHLDGVKT